MELFILNATATAPALTREGCNGATYGTPASWVGLYVITAVMALFVCMSHDLVQAFIHRKPFVPCRWFNLNAITLAVLGYAAKTPVDFTIACDPRLEDHLSKLTSAALLCTSLGFYVPSLGTITPTDRYGNLAALSVTVITMAANLFKQAFPAGKKIEPLLFKIEHLIIVPCILVMLLVMWSSAIAVRGQTEFWPASYRSRPSLDPKKIPKNPQGLKALLLRFHVLSYTGSPQTLLCETSHQHTIAVLCTLSSVVVFKAILGSIPKFSSHPVESFGYKWSIPYIIAAQSVTIAVGTLAIVCRWVSFLIHTDISDFLWAHKTQYSPERELELLKLKTLSLRVLRGKLSNVFLVSKDFIMNMLICTQIALYTWSSLFIGCPISGVKYLLEFQLSEDNTNDIEEMLKDLPITMGEINDKFTLSLLGGDFEGWISKTAIRDTKRLTDSSKDCTTHLIQLISDTKKKQPWNSSECFGFKSKLESQGKFFFEDPTSKGRGKYVYRVSCVSVLVLSRILLRLMPSSGKDLMKQSLDESFEIIDYVDRRHTPSVPNDTRWTAAKELWAQWENRLHWFRRKVISKYFKRKYDEKELKQCASGILDGVGPEMEENFKDARENVTVYLKNPDSLATKHENLVKCECIIICKFLAHESKDDPSFKNDPSHFLQMCFVKMIYCFLSCLPLAILKEMDGDDPTKVGEDKVCKALKLLAKLESLGDNIEWSWADNEPGEPANQRNVSHDVAHHCGSEVNSDEVSIDVDRKVDHFDASLAAANTGGDDNDDGDTIREL